MSSSQSVESQKLHDKLGADMRCVLGWFKRKKWIFNYCLVPQNDFCDQIGIDGIIWFKFNKGKRGDLSFQIKTRQSDVAAHFKKHPGIKAVIVLRPGSSQKKVMGDFIKFLLEWNAFNEGVKENTLLKNIEGRRVN